MIKFPVLGSYTLAMGLRKTPEIAHGLISKRHGVREGGGKQSAGDSERVSSGKLRANCLLTNLGAAKERTITINLQRTKVFATLSNLLDRRDRI